LVRAACLAAAERSARVFAATARLAWRDSAVWEAAARGSFCSLRTIALKRRGLGRAVARD